MNGRKNSAPPSPGSRAASVIEQVGYADEIARTKHIERHHRIAGLRFERDEAGQHEQATEDRRQHPTVAKAACRGAGQAVGQRGEPRGGCDGARPVEPGQRGCREAARSGLAAGLPPPRGYPARRRPPAPIVAHAIGTFRKKIARHENAYRRASRPPTGPTADVIAPTPAQVPIAWPCAPCRRIPRR